LIFYLSNELVQQRYSISSKITLFNLFFHIKIHFCLICKFSFKASWYGFEDIINFLKKLFILIKLYNNILPVEVVLTWVQKLFSIEVKHSMELAT